MSQEITDKIRAAASAKGIDPELALSIARAESSLTPTARAKTSTAGGLFQVIDETWKQHGGKPGKKFDVDENIRVGTDVIAKNARQLKSALGRDPSNADIYAAHHFGATGAAQLLSADPATPIDRVFSGKVIRANPHLKGKTSGEVVAQLESKVGKSSKAAQAPVVSRETPTPAEEIMTPALRSGMTAKLQDLGPSYQAALALSMLSDSDDTKGEKDIDNEPSVAQQWLAQQSAPLPALAELANMRIRSPFPEPQQPVMMNEGGDASTAAQMLRGLVPMDIRTFGATLAGDRSPITEANFNPDELAAMQQAVDKAAARTGRTQKGSVQYEDYPRGEEIGPGYQPVGHTLGRFTYEKSPTGQTTIRDTYDFYNEGRKANVEAYEKMGRMEKTGTVAYRMLKNMLKMDPRSAMNELGDAAIGRDGREVRIQLPVKRADGSPKGGESAEPTPEELEAAAKPAFLTPKSGIGRKISTKPGEIEAAALQGVSETPYNVLGAPVDLATMAMRPFGYSVQAPIGGSEWLKQQASRAGVRQEPPSGAAARALYELGQLGGSAINPAAPVRRAAQAAEAVQESGKAAQMLEGMKNIPVGASVKPVEPFFQHTPSADAPFVGRLDEFVAGLQNPVRKDQFLGQLKGKFRDYDIARAESVLKDLPADAKLTPSDLLNRLKTRYDPANIRTTVHGPRDTGFWRDQDNPYQDQPVGVIHMSTHVSPEQAQRMAQLDKLDSQLFRAGDVSYTSTARIPELDFLRTNPIANTQVANLERSRQDLINHSAPLFEAKRLMNEYMYPATTPMYMGSMKDRALWDEAMATAKRNGVPENQQVTYANELVMDSIRQPAMQKMQQMLGTVPRNESQLVDAVRAKQGQLWDDQRKSLAQDIAGMAQDMRRYFVNNAEKYGLEKPYKGRDIHYGLEPPVNAAGFTRFVPQTVQDPDRGPLKGIHLLEIQSDLTSELKAGTKPKLADKQVFPNMPENRRVVQQLGMKNAIAAAINRGDQFVTFPGKESKKPELYESVRDNLKAVAKDLGPGFEIRPFTFTSPEKGEIQHWGITWGPDAGKRIQQKGVPFKDGGAVERNTADHRKYL